MNTENGPPEGGSEVGDGGGSAGETAQSLLSDIAAKASEGLKRGKQDAERAAEQAIPAIKRGLDKTAYSTSYYVAFGLVYTGRLAMELLPEHGAIRQGAADGARAANDVFEHRKRAAAESSGGVGGVVDTAIA